MTNYIEESLAGKLPQRPLMGCHCLMRDSWSSDLDERNPAQARHRSVVSGETCHLSLARDQRGPGTQAQQSVLEHLGRNTVLYL
jgi:hypothetical protein